MMEPELKSLKDMVGQLIVARIPALDSENMVFIRLLSLEAAGIWVESHTFNQEMLERFEMPFSTTTLILFVPFAAISYVVASMETISLSEPRLGLTD